MFQNSCIKRDVHSNQYGQRNWSKEKNEFAMDVLNNDLFPHCDTREKKLFFLGYMTKKLIMARLGKIPQDDRDSYINKRIDTCGVL